jgi:hypothetical protein
MRVQVKGIPGSGKSYICSQLDSRWKCFDTDDLITAAYDQITRGGKKPTSASVRATARKMFIEQSAGFDRVLLVGILFDMPRADQRFFIKMTREELSAAHTRVIAREVEKWKHVIADKIPTGDGDSVAYCLAMRYHINAFNPVRTLADYSAEYKQALEFERDNGLVVKSQKDIIALLS